MRMSMPALAVASGMLATGCLTGFRHPLGPVGQGFVEERLRGTWSCVGDDGAPFPLAILDFDGRQYYLEARDGTETEPARFRGHATRLEGLVFLSLREIGRAATDEWTLLEYRLTPPDALDLRYVDPDSFQDIVDEPEAVRARLASFLDDPQTVTPLLSCRRSEAAGRLAR